MTRQEHGHAAFVAMLLAASATLLAPACFVPGRRTAPSPQAVPDQAKLQTEPNG